MTGQRRLPGSGKLASKSGAYIVRKVPARDATVEFRLHAGTLDATELIQWTKLCVRLVEYAASCTTRDIDRLNRSAMRALMRHVAPDCKDWIIGKVKAHREMDLFDRRVGYTAAKGYSIGLSEPIVGADDGVIYACVDRNGQPGNFYAKYSGGRHAGPGISRGPRKWAQYWAAYHTTRGTAYNAVILATDMWEVRNGTLYTKGENLGTFDANNNDAPRRAGRRTYFGTKAWANSWAKYQNDYDGGATWHAEPVYGDRATASAPEPAPEPLTLAPSPNDDDTSGSWYMHHPDDPNPGRFYSMYNMTTQRGSGPIVTHGSYEWAMMVQSTDFARTYNWTARRVS
jgi:hypothetical protein